ncbi:MAG: RNA chaperone Hfq [Oscillospiraceae bacterium]|nr:RNA chaperone Hfq [Oscillospiraceae bacterium]
MTRPENLQDRFLNQARKDRTMLTLFLMNGFQLRGTIISFDQFAVLVLSEGRQNLIYKHAISTIQPSDAIRMGMPNA